MLNKIKEALTGLRKFTVMIILISVGVVFRIKGLINGSELVDLLKTVGVAFMAGNLVERITEVVKEKLKGNK